jgi:hypothetical protein
MSQLLDRLDLPNVGRRVPDRSRVEVKAEIRRAALLEGRISA